MTEQDSVQWLQKMWMMSDIYLEEVCIIPALSLTASLNLLFCFLPCLSSPPTAGRSYLFPFEDGFLDDGHSDLSMTPGLNSPTRCQNGERIERYSRKVFVGGLPPDIDEGQYLYFFLY